MVPIFFSNNRINHRKSPAQSPGLNSIGLVWHNLKAWLASHWRPSTKIQLQVGIQVFWRDAVTVEYCNSKINHLEKVLKKVIQYNGRVTGL